MFQCESFRKLPVEKRFEIVKNAHLCINCLRSQNHQAKNCTAGLCRTCGKTHNTLLHFESSKGEGSKDITQSSVSSPKPVTTSSAESPSPAVTQCTQINNASRVFFSTAIVDVYDYKGEIHGCRILLDSGSQLSFITEKFVNKLQLDCH